MTPPSQMFSPEQVADLLSSSDGDYDDELGVFVSVKQHGATLTVTLSDAANGDSESFTVKVEKGSSS